MNIFERIRVSEKLRMLTLDNAEISNVQTSSVLQAHVGRWKSLQKRVAGRGLLATILTVGSLTLLVKLVAAGKEVVVARQLGVGDAMDAFVIAFTLPTWSIHIIATAFNSALIPTYIEVRKSAGRKAAWQLFSGVMFWSLGLLLLTSAVLAFLFPLILPYFASGFSPEKLALTRLLFWVMLPIVTITGLGINWTAVLNAEEKFALPAATPMITSLVVVGILLFRIHTWGVLGMALGTLVGAVLEAALIGIYLFRQGGSLLPRWQGMDVNMRQVLRQYAPLSTVAIVFSGMGIVDQAVASRLGPGSVAVLNYGTKIVLTICFVTATAVGTSVLPHFSRLVANSEWNGLRDALRKYTLLILLTLIPLALLVGHFSLPLVQFGFQRGAFTAHDAEVVSHVQTCFALQIPVFTLGMMYLRLISALKLNRKIFAAFSANIILNFVLDILFAKYLGVAGIALSTTVVTAIFAIGFYQFLIRAIPIQEV